MGDISWNISLLGNTAELKAFLNILASTYGPGADGPVPGPHGPGPLVIWKNILSQICARAIIWNAYCYRNI